MFDLTTALVPSFDRSISAFQPLTAAAPMRTIRPMRLQDIIRAPKTEIDPGKWGQGKLPKKAMPLSKAGRRAYNIGSAWRWRFAEFTALERRFVIRLIVNEGKMKATAHLAERRGPDSAVLACYEYHADLQTGWHLHAICGELEGAPSGTLVHGPWVRRLPGARNAHRRKAFFNPDAEGGAEAWLWQQTMRFFGVEEKGPLV
ncbi:MAG TPA: hypothetical protein VEZ20_01965 [Allosphingosinicella sp.]|nr:hypothetical protein [Allosphingosinicella sp.]